jgi:multiple sugar transport system substrate-binding protein
MGPPIFETFLFAKSGRKGSMFMMFGKMSKVTVVILCISIVLTMFTGCSKSGGTEDKKPISTTNEPVTIKLAASNTQFSEEDFNRYIAEPVKKKYPYITVQRINTSDKGSSVTELVAAGNVPDLVSYYPGNLSIVNDLALAYNIEELIKKHHFDLNRIVPEAQDAVRIGSNQSYLIGLPTYNNPFGLFYNKDLFDKFGVAYPKDGMTWEELRNLSVSLTRMDGGIQYRGLYADSIYRGARQLSIPYADIKTNKSVLNTGQWQDLFKLWENIYSIPGLLEGAYKTLGYGANDQSFLKGELAMLAGYSNTLNSLRKASNVNWDIVTYPSNSKAPGVGHRLDSPILCITAQSKEKDAAFMVLETILSDEVQTEFVRNGRMTVLSSQKVRDEFGKGVPEFQGKNVLAMSKPKIAKMVPIQNMNEGEAEKIINNAFQAVVNKEKDINTALRDADEQLNKHIDSQMKK